MSRGHIRKREKGVYQLVVEAPAGPDGRRRQRYETVRGTLREAQDRLNHLLLDTVHCRTRRNRAADSG